MAPLPLRGGEILGERMSPQTRSTEYTPVEIKEGVWLKRDDLYRVAGVRGGKVRTCYNLALKAKEKESSCLITASSRSSPQCLIVAAIAKHFGMSARIHTPSGKHMPEMISAKELGAEIIQHKAGYNTVICAAALAEANGGYLIPFGMECWEAVEGTRNQVRNILDIPINRIIVPVGSGMSLCGILWGLNDYGILGKIPILGAVVGANPVARLDRYAPMGWRNKVDLIKSTYKYSKAAKLCTLGDLLLDPIYEAKCLPYIRKGDLLWVVGVRGLFDENTKNKSSFYN